jgi:hypothetical protein
MEETMSQRLKTGLIIGGAVVGLVVICLVAFLILSPGSANVYSDSLAALPSSGAAPEPAMDFEMAEEGMVEAPMAEEMAADESARGVGGGPSNTNVTVQQVQERLIIRNGNINVAVEDTKAAQQDIEDLVAQYTGEGAFVVSRNESGGVPGGSPYINMTIRVPVDRFDEVMDFIADLAAEGTTPTRNESGQDVTEEYVDLQARLGSLEAARDRLLGIMEEAQTTEDLLMAEQQLTQREAEIESIQGRIQFLSQSAALSRIDISLEPYVLSQPVDTRWRPAETFRRAIDNLVNSLRDFADFLIIFVISVLPWLLLFGAAIYGVVRFVSWRVRVGRARRAARDGTGGGQDEEHYEEF